MISFIMMVDLDIIKFQYNLSSCYYQAQILEVYLVLELQVIWSYVHLIFVQVVLIHRCFYCYRQCQFEVEFTQHLLYLHSRGVIIRAYVIRAPLSSEAYVTTSIRISSVSLYMLLMVLVSIPFDQYIYCHTSGCVADKVMFQYVPVS